MTPLPWKCVKKSAMKQRAPLKSHAPGDPALASLQLTDNEDNTLTINGVNKAGEVLDLSATYTLTPAPTSSDPSIVSVDAPVGMTIPFHGLKVGTATITATATQNAGVTPAAGPVVSDTPIVCTADPNAVGIIATPGVPVPRP